MIKLVTFLKSNDSLRREAFETRWHNVHAPMAAKFPGLRGYMLSFSVEPGDVATEGVAQLWFDSREQAQDSYASETGRAGSADANAFLARREHVLVSETWATTRPDTLAHRPYKLMLGVKRGDEARPSFVERWNAIDGEAVARATGASAVRLCTDEAGQLLNFGTAGTPGLVTGEAVFDGLLETWLDTPERAETAAERFARSSVLERIVAGAERSEMFLLRENVILRPPPPAYGEE